MLRSGKETALGLYELSMSHTQSNPIRSTIRYLLIYLSLLSLLQFVIQSFSSPVTLY